MIRGCSGLTQCWIRCARTAGLRGCYASTIELRFSRPPKEATWLERKNDGGFAATRPAYFGEACSAAWYSGFLWYSTRRKPQLIRVERSFVLAFLSFRNFSILIFSSRC